MKWLMTYPEDRPAVSAYTRWVESAGIGWEICTPAGKSPPEPDRFDALLLTGGTDIDPALYEALSVHPETYGIDRVRDQHEITLVEQFSALGRPVFGICRGIQIINVALGGRLIQHIPDYLRSLGRDPATEIHHEKGSYNVFHFLNWLNPGRLAEYLDFVSESNSSHHQSVDPASVGHGLQVSAISPAGVVEAVESVDGVTPTIGVQWHPEQLPPSHKASSRLLACFRDICVKFGQHK